MPLPGLAGGLNEIMEVRDLAVPAVQLLSCTVRGKQSLFTDFVALKLTWDDVINQVFVPPGF